MDKTVTEHELSQPVVQYASEDFIALRARSSVAEALECIRSSRTQSAILYFYVVDDEGRLVGVVPTRRLLTSSLTASVESIMTGSLVSIPDNANLLEALEFFILYKFLAFPVVDADRKILGVIDVNLFTQEMIDMEEREQVHSIFDTLGVSVAEMKDRSPFSVFRRRFPWLLATIASGTVCALLVGFFEATLAQSLILAFFLTLVLGLGESVSTQTMAITVHFMHHRRARSGWYFEVLRRELSRTLLLALACGAIVGAIAWIWRGEAAAAFVIGGGIFLSLLLAGLIGVSVPSLLHRFKLDLRVASGPLTLALADICTVVAYFSLATKILVP
ncbi:MAG TPA: magnesium transporter [Smithellaceae bacterium]|jgi:magnesium transporter|nr:magnesium transporter [Smithellaceae bacterium]